MKCSIHHLPKLVAAMLKYNDDAKKTSSFMINTRFTKQERVLLIAALDNKQEHYERKARWLLSRIPGYYDDIYLPKIKLLESIKQKLILLDTEEDEHHRPEEGRGSLKFTISLTRYKRDF